MQEKRIFKIDWVLNDELVVGPLPKTNDDIHELKVKKISAVLSLCSIEETPNKINLEDHFNFRRLVLPDHKYKNPPTLKQINLALEALEFLKLSGPVYVHCVAGIERSPLVCMAWLIRKHNLNPTQALDYLMSIHAGTNPLPEQLKLLFLL